MAFYGILPFMYCAACGAELPLGARFCPRCGKAIHSPQSTVQVPGSPAGIDAAAQQKEITELPIAERKQVTVLFADFAGFTAFSHKRDVEEVRDHMDLLWTRLDGIIAKHG